MKSTRRTSRRFSLERLEAKQLLCATAICNEDRIMLGDTNLDGRVNFADFLQLSANFGKTNASFADGDFDGNGTVAFADFLSLSANFGEVNAPDLDPFTSADAVHLIDPYPTPRVDIPDDVAPLILIENSAWRQRTLEVIFLDGSDWQREQVIEISQQWEPHANIDFVFPEQTTTPEIAVTFAQDGNWSKLGSNSARFARSNRPSMSLENVTEGVLQDRIQRIILHEFGHALGFHHEHQSPAAGIPWNREAVYAELAPLGFDRRSVDANFFDILGQNSIRGSEYDPDSVMHYAIPNRWTIGDFSVPDNITLSELDKEFAGVIYPFLDLLRPTATVISAPDVIAAGENTYRFMVAFDDDEAIDVSDLDNTDIRVSTGDSLFYSRLARFVGVDFSTDGARRVATYEITARGGTWDRADNATYKIFMNTNAVRDTSGNSVPFDQIGSFDVAIEADGTTPTASLLIAANVLAPNSGPYRFSVRYDDDRAINVENFDNTDIRVTTGDSNFFSELARFVRVDNDSNGTPRIVTYEITPRGGAWDASDNATYRVVVNTNAVKDVDGNSVPFGEIGSFSIAIPPVDPPPSAVLSSAPPTVSSAGASTYRFTVTYTDAQGIDVSDLNNTDIRVTTGNSEFYSELARFVSVNVNSDGSPRVATYEIQARGGSWDSGDNAIYNIYVNTNQVSDTEGDLVPFGQLGAFVVSIG